MSISGCGKGIITERSMSFWLIVTCSWSGGKVHLYQTLISVECITTWPISLMKNMHV